MKSKAEEEADELWSGRQIERHAARAAEASRKRAELRARLVELAAGWRGRAAQLRAPVPFGAIGDEPSAQTLIDSQTEARALERAAGELEALAEEG